MKKLNDDNLFHLLIGLACGWVSAIAMIMMILL